ncbi:hypothetical protein D3C86_2127980 [compost metagenome]
MEERITGNAVSVKSAAPKSASDEKSPKSCKTVELAKCRALKAMTVVKLPVSNGPLTSLIATGMEWVWRKWVKKWNA